MKSFQEKSQAAESNMRNGLWVEHTIHVCTYDIDFAAHVSNIAYLRWLEDMRFQLFEKYFPLKTFMDVGKAPILVSTNIQYKKPIRLFSNPKGFMWISSVAKASLIISAEITVDGVVTTTAEHVGAFIELSTGKVTRMPNSILTLFEEANAPK